VGPHVSEWGSSVPVSDLDSLKQQRSFCREFGENETRMANVNSSLPGMPCPVGMQSLEGTLRPQEDTFLPAYEEVLLLDYSAVSTRIKEWMLEQVERTSTTGLVFGLSGGIDSSVVAVLARQAFAGRCLGLILPCHSNPTDVEDAMMLADRFDIKCWQIDLTPVFDLLHSTLTRHLTFGRMAEANIKPRLRMITLYAVANELNYLVAGTGNRSEIETGYFTKYGDGGVDIEPIGDLLKTEIRQLARFLGVPDEIVDKPPSAGLWESQTDEAEMGITYEELDAFLMSGQGDTRVRETVTRLHSKSEHKRHTPPICHIDRARKTMDR